MAFLDDRYLLSGDTAVGLYEGVQALPIIDAHNHADVRALAEDRHFSDIWEAEAATDHYVWECLRKRGVPERLLTGAADNRDKWQALAEAFPDLVGNPTYEWVHLDLKRRFGIEATIDRDSAAAIWERTRAALAEPGMSQQALIRAMGVEAMCSTDDPVDSLEHHQRLQSSPLAGVVRPTFRPDRAMAIFKPDWRDYVGRLEQRVNGRFEHVRDLVAALQVTHDYFAENRCVASDHGVEVPYGYQVSEADADAAFCKARRAQALSPAECVGFMSYILNEVAEMDAAKGWVFQLHMGAVRDVRERLRQDLGPDTGGDVSDHATELLRPLNPLLNRFDDRLQIVLYHLNPIHTGTLAQLTRAYGAKVNLGVAWWLNDSWIGMKRQLEYIGSVDALMNLAGMVSDSRKVMSYGSRHEMFRRTLADVVGAMVDRGQMPLRLAERLVTHLCYERPKTLFGLV
ncbi:MAG: glucuronate isomerase [Lentisphaerae bacterium]|nr:glucuronate isomerase [Lentisphaerota bacterium]